MPASSNPLPSRRYLRECFNYDLESGELSWRRRPLQHFRSHAASQSWNTENAGHIAGWKHNAGYRAVCLNWRKFLVHRIIWKMMTGKDPDRQIDHINGISEDNRWSNLRLASNQQNLQNHGARRDSKTGVKGVQRLPHGSFRAQIRVNGKIAHLGCFGTPEAAHAAYCEAARRLHGKFFNPG